MLSSDTINVMSQKKSQKLLASTHKEWPIPKYNDDMPAKIVKRAKKSEHGLMRCEIALELEIAESTLYDWAIKYPAFSYALEICTALRQRALIKQYNDNHVTLDKDVRFYDRANIDYLKLCGQGSNFKCVRGVDNEHQAMAKLQDAVSSGEISQDAAMTMTKILESKVNIRKSLTVEADIESIKKHLGME